MTLVEREVFVAELDAALAGARNGTGSIVLVSGEAGIGKTALVDHFAGRVAHQGGRCLLGACDAFITPRVLGPIFDIARSAGGRLAALVHPSAEREHLFALLLEELQRVDGTVVVIEDVHWADEATLDALRFLARRIRDTGAVLVITFRDDELPPRHALRGVLSALPAAATRRLSIPRLSRRAVERMAAEGGRPPAGVYALTSGNPFFVTEVLAAEGTVPASVGDAVLGRAARLSEPAIDVLDAVSLAPRQLERWLLDSVLRPEQSAIHESLAVGILEARADALAFRHEIARRAWHDMLEPGRTRMLHARMLNALVSQPSADSVIGSRPDLSIARLVHHAAGAGDRQMLLRLAPQAGREAAQLGAHREAAAHFSTAVAVATDSAPAERADLLEALMVELFLSGEADRALQAAQEGLALRRDLEDTRGQSRILRWMSRFAWYAGDGKSCHDAVVEALNVLDGDSPCPELAAAYSMVAGLYAHRGQLREAVESAGHAIRLARELKDDRTLVHALNNLGYALLTGGDEAGLVHIQQSFDIAFERGFHDDAARARANLAELALELRDDRAEEFIEADVAFCTWLDLGPLAACASGLRAVHRMRRGDWSGAVEDATTSIAHPSALPLNSVRPLVVLGLVRARRGDPSLWQPLDEAAGIAASSEEIGWLSMAATARAEAAWLDGRPDRIRQEVESTYTLALSRGNAWTVGELAHWMSVAGAVVPAEVVDVCAPPLAAQLRGDWRSAERLWAQLGHPYERALALARCGPDQGRQALVLLHGLGAQRAAEVVASQLRRLGIRRVPRGPRRATRKNPANLTPRQVKVLALVAEGLTNAEIARRLYITPKTVEHHVGAILVKLGATSRIDAANRARELGLLVLPAAPAR